jgi:hypothetical protein
MEESLAIVAYRCEVAGEPTESIDIQVRYFASGTASEIEERLRTEATHSYANDHGETVSWPFVRVLAVESLDKFVDGTELVGFVTGCNEFAKWCRHDT